MISGVSANNYVSYPVKEQPQKIQKDVEEAQSDPAKAQSSQSDVSVTKEAIKVEPAKDTKPAKEANQAKIDENKPYHKGGKASLKYLKEAQYKLDNDPTYDVLKDRGLNTVDILTVAVYDALDPEIVEKRAKEFVETHPYYKEFDIDVFNEDLKKVMEISDEEEALKKAGKLDKKAIEQLEERRSKLFRSFKYVPKTDKNDQEDEKSLKEQISKNVQKLLQPLKATKSAEEILNNIDMQSIKDERTLLTLKINSKDDKRLEKWV